MLRFIGALVVVLLIVGPLLDRAGMLPSGFMHDLVAFEVYSFESLVAWVGNLVNGRRG